jgi:hypothetical protein
MDSHSKIFVDPQGGTHFGEQVAKPPSHSNRHHGRTVLCTEFFLFFSLFFVIPRVVGDVHL